MRTTFINQNSEGDIETVALQYLSNRKESFDFFMKGVYQREDLDHVDEEEREDLESAFDMHGSFFDFGLFFDFVDADENSDGYYRYQLGWGGPSDEIRFYKDGTVEYVYFDWFCGVGFDVSCEDWAEWLFQHFSEICMIDFDSKAYEELYQEAHVYEEESEDEE
jgi:hypothetical protein